MNKDERSFLINMLERHDRISDEERQAIIALPARMRSFASGEELVSEDSRPEEACLIVEGFAARAQYLANGKRQISAVHIPGDFVDLHSMLLKVMDHAVIAVGPCRAAFVPHINLRRLTETHPHLTRLLWHTTLVDAAIQRAWIVSLGRMSAEQQMGHLLCELYTRLRAVGVIEGDSFDFPPTQAMISDMLGMSTVYVNKTLANLRATGFVEWRDRRVRIVDFDRLAEMCEFDPRYLNLWQEPR